jgi:hypothetical protein
LIGEFLNNAEGRIFNLMWGIVEREYTVVIAKYLNYWSLSELAVE